MPAIYCHSCQAQFSVPQNEGVCPNCGGGFVEEVAQARSAAAGPTTGSGTYSARSYTLPGGMGNVRIVTSTGGALPPGFGGGFGGPGMGGDPFVNSVLEALLGGGFVHPGAGAGPFAGMPMPAMGGGMAQEQEWLDQVMSRIMNEYQPPSQAAAQRAVRSLPKLTVRAKDAAGEPGEGEALARAGEPCSVCHDEYREGEEVLELPCGHNYHADCLLPWLETHNTCPGGCFDSLLLAWSW
ncbi:hypothetical protein COHA_009770 [Chlorella ohadii]|uniref:RING-type E3 ubiquitin transferase n=1 Tax=Chlorella ohadii TaxID=2649997 RepID=A0AAD5H1W7_9CHLO|nr:hypothetical protein COHA_009770 [Chlorella ohadii]